MVDASICGLGQAAPNPVAVVMQVFPARGRVSTDERADDTAARDDADRVQAQRRRRSIGRPDETIIETAKNARRRDPAPLLQGRHAARRQLPRLHGRDQGRARARAVVLPLSERRAWRSRPTARARVASAEDGARAAAVGHAGDGLHARTPSSITGRRSWTSASRASRARQQPAEPTSRTRRWRCNLDACIQCTRCVRACREEQVNDVIGYAFRGAHSKIVFDLDDPMGDSTCVACGECVQACPTGALMPARDVGLQIVRQDRSTRCARTAASAASSPTTSRTTRSCSSQGKDGPANHEPPVRQGPLRLRLRRSTRIA